MESHSRADGTDGKDRILHQIETLENDAGQEPLKRRNLLLHLMWMEGYSPVTRLSKHSPSWLFVISLMERGKCGSEEVKMKEGQLCN